jgi:ferric-dicitrate binding protein FerR (iron transport regulator)
MSDDRHEHLIDDFLQGRSDRTAIREVERLIREDAGFREALAETALVEAALSDRPAAGVAPAPALRRVRPRPVVLVAASIAAAALAAGLWLVTVPGRRDGCQVVETRGRVLLLAETPAERSQALGSGDKIATGRRIWTCPWGAVAVRLGDGSRIQLDRGSEARLLSTSRPDVELTEGIVFVTRQAGLTGSATITSRHASVALEHGLAAVTADEDRTVVEVAEGEAWLRDRGHGEQTRITAGQVAVVEPAPEGGIRILPGRLRWELPADPEG